MLKGVIVPDFILKISSTQVSCFISNDLSFSEDITFTNNFAKNIKIASNAVSNVVAKAERSSLKRLKKCIVLTNFGPLSKHNIKVLRSSALNFNEIRRQIEQKIPQKIISISYLGYEGEHNILQVLTMEKQTTQSLVDVISNLGIEVLEVKPDFKFVAEQASSHYHKKNVILVKLFSNSCEFAKVLNGGIFKYSFIKEFGLEAILGKISQLASVKKADLQKILTFYSTTSKIDRLKVFYEREKLDFALKEIVGDTRLISEICLETKKVMKALKEQIFQNLGVEGSLPISFYFEESFMALNLHKFLEEENEMFEFENFVLTEGLALQEKKAMVESFVSQMKKIFHLTA